MTTTTKPAVADRNAVLEEAAKVAELRSRLFGGEPLNANERALANHMIEGIRALKTTTQEPKP